MSLMRGASLVLILGCLSLTLKSSTWLCARTPEVRQVGLSGAGRGLCPQWLGCRPAIVWASRSCAHSSGEERRPCAETVPVPVPAPHPGPGGPLPQASAGVLFVCFPLCAEDTGLVLACALRGCWIAPGTLRSHPEPGFCLRALVRPTQMGCLLLICASPCAGKDERHQP